MIVNAVAMVRFSRLQDSDLPQWTVVGRAIVQFVG
jgi:hypothetical protein